MSLKFTKSKNGIVTATLPGKWAADVPVVSLVRGLDGYGGQQWTVYPTASVPLGRAHSEAGKSEMGLFDKGPNGEAPPFKYLKDAKAHVLAFYAGMEEHLRKALEAHDKGHLEQLAALAEPEAQAEQEKVSRIVGSAWRGGLTR